jgi:hypothetical protein
MTKTAVRVACYAGAMLIGTSLMAQNTNRFTFGVGGGFTTPVKSTEGRLNTGFNILAGAGVNVSKEFGILAEFGFHNMGITDRILDNIGVPQGSTRIYSATLNPVIRFNPTGRFGAYITGGGGFYRRTIEFTEPTFIETTGFDPFYGVFFPALVPANSVIGSFSQNRAGVNGGAGVTIGLSADSNAKFFAEARYHHLFTSPVRTTLVPVTFGIRW